MTSTLKPPDSEMPQILYVGWDGDRMEYFADSTPPPIDPDYPHAEYVRSPSPSKGMPTREELREQFEKEWNEKYHNTETSARISQEWDFSEWLVAALSERDKEIERLKLEHAGAMVKLTADMIAERNETIKSTMKDCERQLWGWKKSCKELQAQLSALQSSPGVEMMKAIVAETIDICVGAMKSWNVSAYDVIDDGKGNPEQEQFDIIGYIGSLKEKEALDSFVTAFIPVFLDRPAEGKEKP
jgi:hypothetical protein